MLFNSLSFAFFLPIVFIVYWFVCNKSIRLQNILLVVASYYFYACWDWRFLFLLIFSTSLDYVTAIKMSTANNQKAKSFWFWLSIGINLGFLGFFKYYNFFINSFAEGLSALGLQVNLWTLEVILPVGISFYTFHGLSYVIDIYNDKIKVERNFIDYSVFVSFFPLLVAGPIERATHLLPQIQKKRTFNFDNAADGLRQILWGLFKKIVIADKCAIYANEIFNNSADHSGSALFLGAVYFAFQIYGDFSGYSDIAIGTAKLFGIDLLKNFSYPYFSRDIAEFWRRWHISLSSWFRDYLYIPLGGSKGGMWMSIRNVIIIFLVSGFWHGANWTFIVWGFLNALFILPSIIFKTNRNNLDVAAQNSYLPSIKEFFQITVTFCLTTVAWIFFRAGSLTHALNYISDMFSRSLFAMPDKMPANSNTFVMIAFFFVMEWLGRRDAYALEKFGLSWKRPIRWVFYYALILVIFYCMDTKEQQQFIYFQF
jgi:alginate O-acetyltransferase complex protein AlgI